MNAPVQQDNRVLLGSSQPQHRLGGNDTFDEVISRHRDTYQWALTNNYTMERCCLLHVVLRHLQGLEGLVFLERGGADQDWVPASENQIEQCVIEALEQGLEKGMETITKKLSRHSI